MDTMEWHGFAVRGFALRGDTWSVCFARRSRPLARALAMLGIVALVATTQIVPRPPAEAAVAVADVDGSEDGVDASLEPTTPSDTADPATGSLELTTAEAWDVPIVAPTVLAHPGPEPHGPDELGPAESGDEVLGISTELAAPTSGDADEPNHDEPVELHLTMATTAAAVSPDTVFGATFTLTNHGPGDAHDVRLSYDFGDGLRVVRSVHCDNDPFGTDGCDLGTIKAGETVQAAVLLWLGDRSFGSQPLRVSVSTGDEPATMRRAGSDDEVLSSTTERSPERGDAAGDDSSSADDSPGSDDTGTDGTGSDGMGSGGTVVIFTPPVIGVTPIPIDAPAASPMPAELSVVVVADTAQVPAGDTVTYTVFVSNAGPGVASETSLAIAGDVPGVATLVESTGCNEDPLGVPTCTIGTLAANSTRLLTFTYAPPAGTQGELGLAATVASATTDPIALNDTARIDVAFNVAPTANPDTAAFTEGDSARPIDVAGNDSDADGDLLTVVSIDDSATVGVVTLANGTVTYDPNGAFVSLVEGATATDTFTYTVADGVSGTATQTVTITITGVNDAPAATDDTLTTNEDTSVTVAKADLIGDDTDVNGDTVAFDSVDDSATAGAITETATQITFDPNGAFESLGVGESTTDSFTYDITDGLGGSDTGTVTVTVNGVNDTPVATVDTVDVGEDDAAAVLVLLTNDIDVDTNDSLTISAVDDTGTFGDVALTGGAVSFDPAGAFEWLAEGDSSSTSFTYTVTDGNGGSDTATVNVNVTGSNDAPVAVDDVAAAEASGSAIDIDVVANDSDVDAFDMPELVSISAPGIDGIAAVNAGKVRYTPPGVPTTDTFTYVIQDDVGVTTTGSVTVTVSWGPLAPMAFPDAAAFGADDVSAVIDVLGNDTDPNLDVLRVVSIDDTGTVGSVALSLAGVVSFDPNGAFDTLPAGAMDTTSFTYVVTDDDASTANDTATVTITVTGVNDGPVAVADTLTVDEDAVATVVPVLVNDSDIDLGDALEVTSIDTTGATGTVTLDSGTITYDPAGAFDDLGIGDTAVDTFGYTITDDLGAIAQATVTITIDGTNDAPIASDATVTFGEDDPAATVNVTANDADGDPVTIDSVGGTPIGSVALVGGTLGYDPNGAFESLGVGETAMDTFTYTISDDNAATDTGTVTITINGANDAVVANDDLSFQVDENVTAAQTLNVLANDTDPDTNDALTITNVVGNDGTVSIVAGALTYLPDHSAAQVLAAGDTAVDNFTYTVSDGTVSDTASVSVTINGQNDPPTTVPDTLFIAEDATTTVDVIANDIAGEPADNVFLDAVDPASTGVASKATTTEVSYTASGWDHLAAGETATEDVTYTAIDDHGATSQGTLTVTITGVNDAPAAVDDVAGAAMGGPAITIPVLDNDVDPEGATLTVQSVSAAAHGATALVNGDVTYTPNATHLGPDTFTYTITDGALTATATVTVTVSRISDLTVTVLADADPVVAGDTISYTATVANNGPSAATNVVVDIDVPGATISTNVGAVASGASTTAIGSYDTPLAPAGSTVRATARVSSVDVTDPVPGNDSQDVDVTVTATPNADLEIVSIDDSDDPILPLVPNNTTTYTVTVRNNGPDTATVVTATNTYSPDVAFDAQGAGSCAAPGLVCPLGDLAAGQTTTYSVGVAATPNAAGAEQFAASVASPTHDFVPANNNATEDTDVVPPPTANGDAYTSLGNVGISVPAGSGVLGNDTGANLAVTAATGASANGGSFTIAADGSFTYEAPPAAVASDTFTYTVTNTSGSDTGTVTITLTSKIWFVDGSLASAGDGTLDAPFNTVPASVGTDGDLIFVMRDATGAIALKPQQMLIGAGSSASIASLAGLTVPTFSHPLPATGARPTITSTGGSTVGLAQNNTVRGLNLVHNNPVAGSGGAITETSPGADPATVTILEAAVHGTHQAISISGGTQNINLDAVTTTTGTNESIALTASTGGVIELTDLALVSTGEEAVKVSGAATLNITGANNIVNYSTLLGAGPAIDIAALIGPSGVTLQKVDVDGAPNAITLTNTGTGSFTITGTGSTDASGGTFMNISGDAVVLTTVDGPVVLKNVTFSDIGNLATPGISSHDGIHVQGMTGKLTIDNADVNRVSDNFVHGVAGSVFSGGLEVTNSTITHTNRFTTDATAGDTGSVGEGAIWASGITGTVTIANNTFSNGNQFVHLEPTGGSMVAAIDGNSFGNADNGMGDGSGFYCVNIDASAGSHTANIGTVTGNSFTNCEKRSVRVHASGGSVSGTIANNTLVVTDHHDGLFNGVSNWAQGGVWLHTSVAGSLPSMAVTNNTFGASGQFLGNLANLDIQPDGSGASTITVSGNTFHPAYDSAWQVRGRGAADVTITGNTYVAGRLTGQNLGEFGVTWDGPGRPYCIVAHTGANLTVHHTNETLAGHELDVLEGLYFGRSVQIVAETGAALTANVSGVTITPSTAGSDDDISVYQGVGGTQSASGATAIISEPSNATTDCGATPQ